MNRIQYKESLAHWLEWGNLQSLDNLQSLEHWSRLVTIESPLYVFFQLSTFETYRSAKPTNISINITI